MRRYSEDEKINMRLRRQAGESIASIAEDYECTHYTVRYWTDPEFAAHCRKSRNALYRKNSPAKNPRGRRSLG